MPPSSGGGTVSFRVQPEEALPMPAYRRKILGGCTLVVPCTWRSTVSNMTAHDGVSASDLDLAHQSGQQKAAAATGVAAAWNTREVMIPVAVTEENFGALVQTYESWVDEPYDAYLSRCSGLLGELRRAGMTVTLVPLSVPRLEAVCASRGWDANSTESRALYAPIVAEKDGLAPHTGSLSDWLDEQRKVAR